MTDRPEPAASPTAVAPPFLRLEMAGKPLAVSAQDLLLVIDWEEPFPLPRRAPGILGWLPHEGRAVPILDPSGQVRSRGAASLLVLLESGPIRLYLPGDSARFIRGISAALPEDPPPFASGWVEMEGGEGAPLLDVALLYRASHLGYNHSLDG